jgi:two-component sensor histidine kinase
MSPSGASTTIPIRSAALNADTLLVLAYFEAGKKIFRADLDSALVYYLEGLKLADSLQYANGQFLAYRGLSSMEANRGNLEACINYVTKGLQVARSNALPVSNQIDLMINQGAAYINAGQPGKALEGYITAEELARNTGLEEKRAILLHNIGSIYRRLKRYDEAIRIYYQSLAIRQTLHDSLGMANNFYNLGSVYASSDYYELALDNLKKAEDLYRALESESDIQLIQLSTGHALYKLGREEEAFHYLSPLTRQSKLPFDLQHHANLYLTLADYHQKRGDLTKALEYLNTIGPDLENSDLPEFKIEYYRYRALVSNGLGNDSDAFSLLQKHNELSSQLATEESQALRSEMETKYLTKEKELQIRVQEAEILSSNREKWLYAGGLSLFAFLSFLLFRSNNARKKINQELSHKNKIIQTSLQEKNILLKEIHHRVKNNLQVISALLSLQSKYLKDEGAVAALLKGQNRVDSMALIHKDLYQHDNLKGVNTRIYLDRLINNLLESYEVDEGKISIESEIAALWLDVDTMIPLGLLINELISNAIKHAFDGKGGKITVELKEKEDMLYLLVQDNGKGITDLDGMSNDSFGYSLIKSFAQRLNATINVENQHGCSVTLQIKDYHKTDQAA